MELEDIKPDKRLIKFRKAYRDQILKRREENKK